MTGFILFEARDRMSSLSRSLLGGLGYGPHDVTPVRWEGVTDADLAELREAGEGGQWVSLYLRRKDGKAIPAVGRFAAGDSVLELEWDEVEATGRVGKPPSVDPASLNFLTTVSHELRVSLNGVVGFSNLLASGELSAEQRETLEKLQACNLLLKGLVNDILEYSRVVSSNLDLVPESVPIAAFAREVCGLFRERANRKGLSLELDCSISGERRLELPKLRVTQVLSNLISNAIKFTDVGSVRVLCELEGDLLRFEVKDTGRGIPLAQSDKVFRPFVQLGPRIGSQEGSGLGLAISKSLAERMGASLSLDHSSASGSVFVFSLPVKRQAMSTRPSRSAGLEEESARYDRTRGDEAPVFATTPPLVARSAKRVLVVEDNQLNADILRHFLRDYGVAYDVVDNGRSAVEVYSDEKYDLVLMDVMLPELNGYEATERILAASKRKPVIPIIGVTAKVFRRDQRKCIECGMVDVVHKPVDFKLLRRVLDRYLYGVGELSEQETPTFEASIESRNALSFDGPFRRSVLEDYIDRMMTSSMDRQDVALAAIKILDTEVGKLLAAIGSGVNADVSMRAHSLKGALALLGARDLLDLVKGLETLASQEGAALRVDHWSRLVERGYDEFKEAVLGYIGVASRRS